MIERKLKEKQNKRKEKEKETDREEEQKPRLQLSSNPLSLGITRIEQDLLHISSLIPLPHHKHFLFDREECV